VAAPRVPQFGRMMNPRRRTKAASRRTTGPRRPSVFDRRQLGTRGSAPDEIRVSATLPFEQMIMGPQVRRADKEIAPAAQFLHLTHKEHAMDEARTRTVRAQLMRDPHGALALLNQDLAQSRGKDPDVFYLIGVSHFRLKGFASAERAFRTSLSLNPHNAAVVYYLGLTAERQGRIGDAISYYRGATAIDPQLKPAWDKLRSLDRTARPDIRPGQRDVPASPLQRDSSLMLPNTDEEFRDFERRINRRKEIETKAEYAAQLKGLPGWAKLLVLVVVIFIAWTLYSGFTAGTGNSLQKDQDQACQFAKEHGTVLPPFCK
jgi:tetratricopeptide (TPR) repeat protein